MNPRSMGAALAASTLVFAPLAFAQAPPPPKPAAEMAQLKMFDGAWSCAGEVPAGPMGPAQKTKTTVKVHTDLGGFWQVGTVTMTSTGMPGVFEGRFQTTYDAGQKAFVMLWADNMGGYSTEVAPAGDADKMVYLGEGSMGGQKMQTRDTFVKAADGSFKRSGEAQINGQWVSMGEETCHRPAPAAAAKK